ncbi:MAG: tail fiber domain-containing protein, partial [Akkermansiaceae bacterium]
TTNAASPVRKTLAFTEDGSSEVSLSSITAAPAKPVVAWGDNNSGQTTLPALANVTAVAAGDAHSVALLADGTVVAWGLNNFGQSTVSAELAGVTQISAGANFNLVRKNDGTVAAWGANGYGQTALPSGITTATQVAAGEKHGLALLADGSVLAWGDDTFGQTTVPTLANVTAIAAGYDHSLALKSDGTVVAWGRDDAGQVTLPDGLSGVTAIAAGAYHSLALKGDGSLVAWGWDGGGQVTLPAGLADVVKIAGGYAFSMALKADGSVTVWGDNSASQTTVPASASLVTHIAAGASHALALRASSIPAQVARLDQDNIFTEKLGIGRSPLVNALEVAGNASKTTAGNWLANSDRRIKSEIRPILGALEKIDQVRLVDFRYTDAYLAKHPVIEDRRYPNVIAQEFAEVFPDDVKSSGERLPDGSEVLQVDTYPLTIYTAAAVQELHRENQALKQQIAAHELRLRKLEAALKQ